MSKFDVKVEHEKNFIILRVSGFLNAENIPEARKKIDSVIAREDLANKHNLNFIIDYKDAHDADSATIANILDRLSAMRDNNNRLVFVNVPENFKSLVVIHGMEDIVRYYDSEIEAKNALVKPECAGLKPVTVKVQKSKRYSWCTCGLSKSQPFCDNAHRAGETALKSCKFTPTETKTVYLCMCKMTKNPPFCDGSHAALKSSRVEAANG